MSLDYPLQFTPVFREYLWGGRRLESVLNKPIGKGPHFAESWEVVDHGDDQSVVRSGDLAGETLHQLVSNYPTDLFGSAATQDAFPLLFKFLDAQKTLSVQVHPNDEQAARLDPPDRGKTEAWIVLAAEPGSKVYAGLKRGFDRAALEREINRGTCELCLHSFEPEVGDCVFIPAGTVHALGEGLLVAEIQQSSDTTYRLFDWNRVDARTGQPRELHVEQGLATIDYDRGPVSAQIPQPGEQEGQELLVDCANFRLERWTRHEPISQKIDRFHLLAVVSGDAVLDASGRQITLSKGETTLIPAATRKFKLTPQPAAVWLDITTP